MIYLLNYDAGNLLSIKRALKYLKFEFSTITEIYQLSNNDILLIPGVGSFASASKRIEKYGLLELAKKPTKNRPFILGICLGMQLMMTRGFEGNLSMGLNLVEGDVDSIYNLKPKNIALPKTIIGWESFQLNNEIDERLNWLKNYENKFFYHVHSYMCIPKNKEKIIASYSKELSFIPNIIGDLEKRVLGFQFHPEKSGPDGLNLLREMINFAIESR